MVKAPSAWIRILYNCFWSLFGKCVGRERKILAESHRITRPYRLVPDPFSEFGLNQIGNTRPLRSFRRTLAIP